MRSPRRSLAAPQRTVLNAQLWQHYVRNEHGACVLLIERELKAFGGQSEFPLYVKGCIERQRGRLSASLQLFQAATCLNPRSVANLKQVARGLYLLGKFRHSLEVYVEAKRVAPEDWQVWHNVGCCHVQLGAPDDAMDAFRMADSIGHHDATYTQMAALHSKSGDFESAIDVLMDAADFTAQNADILTRIGLLYIRLGENAQAFEYLEKALANDAAHAPAILASGSISQDRQEPDEALAKYRVAAPRTPHSAQLWTNIAMCYFAKGKLVAAAACLKRALYLSPLEWIISHDLGLVYLSSEQYASSFEFLRASINLKPDFAPSFMCVDPLLLSHSRVRSLSARLRLPPPHTHTATTLSTRYPARDSPHKTFLFIYYLGLLRALTPPAPPPLHGCADPPGTSALRSPS